MTHWLTCVYMLLAVLLSHALLETFLPNWKWSLKIKNQVMGKVISWRTKLLKLPGFSVPDVPLPPCPWPTVIRCVTLEKTKCTFLFHWAVLYTQLCWCWDSLWLQLVSGGALNLTRRTQNSLSAYSDVPAWPVRRKSTQTGSAQRPQSGEKQGQKDGEVQSSDLTYLWTCASMSLPSLSQHQFLSRLSHFVYCFVREVHEMLFQTWRH